MSWAFVDESGAQGGSDSDNTGMTITHTAAIAGNLLICFVPPDKDAGAFTEPTGYTEAVSSSNTSCSIAIFYKEAAGGETSADPAWTNSVRYQGMVVEYSCLGTPVFDGANSQYDGESNVTTHSSGTAGSLSSGETQAAFYGFGNDTGTGQTLTSYSNGSNREFDFDTPGGQPGIGFAEHLDFSGTSAESTITVSGTADQMIGAVAAFYESGIVAAAILPVGFKNTNIFRHMIVR